MPSHTSLDSLFHLVHALKRNLHDQIEQLELGMTPMHVRVLKIINAKAPCTAIDIANFLHRDKAQVTRLLNMLIADELIGKEPNPEDKRSQYLHITERGKKIMIQISGIDTAIFAQMAQELSPEEIQEFQRIAKHMAHNLQSN